MLVESLIGTAQGGWLAKEALPCGVTLLYMMHTLLTDA